MITLCGSGFLGSELSNELIRSSVVFSQVSRAFQYLHRKKGFEFNFDLQNCQYFINCSGPSSISESLVQPDLYIYDPVLQLKSHFRYFKSLNIFPTYIYFSSAAVYGNAVSPSIEDVSRKPMSPYAKGKVLAEDYLMKESNSYLGRIIVLRVTSSFANSLDTRVLGLIRNSLNTGLPLELWGKGDEVRDFIHTRDIYQGIQRIIESPTHSKIEFYNLGSGITRSIVELVKIALESRGLDLSFSEERFSFNGLEPLGNPKSIAVSIGKIQRLGFAQQYSNPANLIKYFTGTDE